ncbi:hypothetical protein N5B55_04850 [Ralstonia pickettii]|uniref:hypothetical protein n=1 Tax=Ralstonia pickettii TaxID=329 RepID=UPI002714B007|nr:hypothetical protein [Ralstonia pickettii]WKZ86282.1 hypothetical protein N5B55_04850 [Ralstonia pickettii]
MKVKRIASYETTDGQLFTDKNAAKQHQRELDRRANLAKLVSETLKDEMIAGEVIFKPESLADWLIGNQEAIRNLLPQRKPKGEGQQEPAAEQGAANDGEPAAA